MFSLGTLEKGSGPESFSGLGLVGLDRGDICYVIPNLQHCTVLLTIGIGGTLATSHQILLYHASTRHGEKMYQYHEFGLVLLDREEVLVRKRAEFYYRLGSTTGPGSTAGRGQGGILTPDVRSTQAKAAPLYYWMFNNDFVLCLFWNLLFLAR